MGHCRDGDDAVVGNLRNIFDNQVGVTREAVTCEGVMADVIKMKRKNALSF